MTIKTHADLIAAAKKAIDLYETFYWTKHEAIYAGEIRDQIESRWHAFCRAFDEAIYAAGGHRAHLTWHLFGKTITAEKMWEGNGHEHDRARGDYQVRLLVRAFLFFKEGRSAHAGLAMRALWDNPDTPLPTPKSRRKPSLPAVEGRATEAEMKRYEAFRQRAIVRFQVGV